MYTQLQLRDSDRQPVTVSTLARMKADGRKIASLTCYDASFAVLLDEADVDVVLVGDSMGMVIQGHDTTVPVTMDHIVYHTRAVARGLHRPFLTADLGKAITDALHVPVIGIGAGPGTDGQILVLYDILDITTGRKPRFVQNFMKGAGDNREALKRYVQAVRGGTYPAPEHCF